MIKYSLTLVVTLFSLCVASASTNSTLENVMVVRFIDISSQLVIVNTRLNIRQYNHSKPIESYVYIVDPQWVETLSYIEVLDDKKNHLVVERHSTFDEFGQTVLECKILLPRALFPGETIDILVHLILTNYLISYPKSLKQYEKHTVLFPFNIYYYTMYFTHQQTTYLYMGTTKAALIDGAMYTIANDSEYGLQYGPFYRIEPFKNSQSVFHYENNSPFLVVEKVKRHVKLSHWGYISVWDHVRLLNSGPKLKGPYKRNFDKDKNSALQDTRIEGFVSSLPSSAFDIYLKDEIGLIWSYKVDYDHPSRVDVSIEPRCILYGGWRTEYEIGYTLPISEFVTKDHASSEYTLSFSMLDKIYQNMVIKEAEINIILPEGADFRPMDPMNISENRTDAKYCYYFDITCREMITFTRYNLVEKHLNNLAIAYTFSPLNLLVKPMIIAVSIFHIFILLKIVSRQFSSTLEEKKVKRMESKSFPVLSAKKKKMKRNFKQNRQY